MVWSAIKSRRKEQSRLTVISILSVAVVGEKQVVASRNGVEPVVMMEVRTKSALHCGSTAGDGDTESDRDVIDELFEVVASLEGTVEGLADQELGNELAEGYVDPRGRDPVEEEADPCGQVEGTGTGERIWQDADPDSGVGVDPLAVFNLLDGCDRAIRSINIFVVVVLFLNPRPLLFIRAKLAVFDLKEHAEKDEVDRGDTDALFDEVNGNLGTERA